MGTDVALTDNLYIDVPQGWRSTDTITAKGRGIDYLCIRSSTTSNPDKLTIILDSVTKWSNGELVYAIG